MKLKILAGAVAVLIIVVLLKVFLPNESARLRRDIYRLKKAVEEENTNGVLEYIAYDYLDHTGMEYRNLAQTIDTFFTRVDSIKVMFSGLKVSIDSVRKDVFFGSCSLGLRVLANYEGNKALIFGGVIKPGPVQAYFKRTNEYYRLYYAIY